MTRRDLLLEEMGIAPRWRLRDSGSPAGQPAASASSDSAPPAVERREEAPERPAGIAARAGRPPEGAGAAPVASVTSGPVTPVQPAARDVPAREVAVVPVDPEARRRAILGMDWAALEAAVSQCTACPLHARRNKTVFGVGDRGASWLFVGEGPGAEEDARGEPFVGQAGRLLDNMLAAIELKRGENVYIANVVKCRPPNNRNPESAEMSCCEPFLARQIELIRPTLIVAMGKIAASHLLRTNVAVASLRGRLHEYRGTPLLVTYHPAYLLRTLPDKAKAWADLCFARDRMDAIVAARAQAQPRAPD